MSVVAEQIQQNLERIHERIARACERADRAPESVRLVAVTKYAELPWVRELVALGQLELGESRPQQLAARAAELPADVRWHLIGHLQRNKAALVLPHVALIHSVDSERLLNQLETDAERLGLTREVLLEVNVSGEAAKDGFSPETVLAAAARLAALRSVRPVGLMTMAPLSDDPEAARPHFQRLSRLRDDLQQRTGLSLPVLSMGMSGDFEVAIAEGATLVRIGTSLFEGLSPA